ncbi:chemotaxis-specific protein-glutamate methyltransferase CheB [Pseudobacteroides cellulosolvens]|uniref:chemotaxis-specific protein-glutamate methyltransferase CheB n=1 Tax=Pseudobacteroides cellulosolvens TaxID=35825 RepID=UPI00055A9BB5|nr:chemotaxis-specific protein-glutamate methyltransferase CheB [Pseudobacteroides cellulosolvens]
MDILKVLVVDDSAVYRKILSMAVEKTGLALAEHTASNGTLAIERLQHGKYDVVIMDVNMPELDGIQTLKIISERWPETHVIMVSSTGGKNAKTTIEALGCGALDFIIKPLEQDYEKNMEIVARFLKGLFTQIQVKRAGAAKTAKTESTVTPVNTINHGKIGINGVDMVLVASSTGGPSALERIFNGFGRNFYKPMLIVQHMPPDFTRVLAESLDKKSEMKFIEGKDGDGIRAGQAILAPGGYHMEIAKGSEAVKKICITSGSYVNGVRPAADVLFKSVAKEYQGARILTVILTGMGSDGLEGVRELKQKCLCYCITQSEESCVVYGMPRSIKEAGLSDEVLDIDRIAERIVRISEHGS